MMPGINNFIQELASITGLVDVTNHYRRHADPLIDKANAVRCHNLGLYLNQMLSLSPEIMLVGEAPGHRGCRITGIPFTSEYILLEGERSGPIPNKPSTLLGLSGGYQKSPELVDIKKEGSSTILWNAVRRLDQYPLLWNALPLHPHQPGNPWSNRSPTRHECLLGGRFIEELVGLFAINQVVAVGKAASICLDELGYDHTIIRHPSYGGKTQFLEGMRRLSAGSDLKQITT